MPQEIRDDLLKFDATCTTLWNLLVWTICHKTTIDFWHNPLEKPEDIQKQDGWEADSSNKSERKQEATQKIFDIARVREYDIQELLTYYLTDTSFFFDAEGLMVKPNKGDLCSELEKMLEPTDYVQPSAYGQLPIPLQL